MSNSFYNINNKAENLLSGLGTGKDYRVDSTLIIGENS